MWGQKSLFGGEGQPSKGNPPTPSSMKSSLPEGGPKESDSHAKRAVTAGVDTSKKGKEAFQEAVKGTREATPEQALDNRTPSKERVARHGN